MAAHVRLALTTLGRVSVSTARAHGGLPGEQSIMTDEHLGPLDGIPTYVFV